MNLLLLLLSLLFSRRNCAIRRDVLEVFSKLFLCCFHLLELKRRQRIEAQDVGRIDVSSGEPEL